MDLRTYRFVEDTTYTILAKKIKIHRNYLIMIANNRIRPGPKLAIKIEIGTDGKVSRGELRPDLWPPELYPQEV